MNRIPIDRRSGIVSQLVAGETLRTIASRSKVSLNTVMRIMEEIRCENLIPYPPKDILSMSDDGISIILPENFKYPRYMDGLWLENHRRWSGDDLALLNAACDMRLSLAMTGNSLGRGPTNIAWKAHDLGLVLPREWLALIRSKKPRLAPRENLQYPYIVKPDDRHADLIAVNRIVSKQLPGREDVCQDIMLALWESRLSLDELKSDPKAVRAFVRGFRKASFERGGYAESMDVTVSGDSDGRSKYEDARYQRTLVNEEDKFVEAAMFDSRTTPTFVNELMNDMEAEEEALGVPAAFWMRAEIL